MSFPNSFVIHEFILLSYCPTSNVFPHPPVWATMFLSDAFGDGKQIGCTVEEKVSSILREIIAISR